MSNAPSTTTQIKNIEVEKKFLLNDDDAARLLENARLVGETIFHDMYLDTKDLSLASKDWWLRSRNGKYLLKIPATEINPESKMDQYEEIEDNHEIFCKLGLASDSEPFLMKTLNRFGYKNVASFTTTRKEYLKEGFTIVSDYADFKYHIYEIELVVSENKKDAASELIMKFARELQLPDVYVRGKLPEYFARFCSEQFETLKQRGIWM